MIFGNHSSGRFRT
jgi:hypothetical protein